MFTTAGLTFSTTFTTGSSWGAIAQSGIADNPKTKNRKILMIKR